MPEFVNKGSAISGGNDMTAAKAIDYQEGAEAQPRHPEIRPGKSYFMRASDENKEALAFLQAYSGNGMRKSFKGAVLYSRRPRDLLEKEGYKFQDTKVRWVTTNKDESAIMPTDISKISQAIKDELDAEMLVVINASEYIVTQNGEAGGFDIFLKLAQYLSDVASVGKGALVISADPKALEEQETRLVLRTACVGEI
jgi:hypothetical protein